MLHQLTGPSQPNDMLLSSLLSSMLPSFKGTASVDLRLALGDPFDGKDIPSSLIPGLALIEAAG